MYSAQVIVISEKGERDSGNAQQSSVIGIGGNSICFVRTFCDVFVLRKDRCLERKERRCRHDQEVWAAKLCLFQERSFLNQG